MFFGVLEGPGNFFDQKSGNPDLCSMFTKLIVSKNLNVIKS